MIAQLLFDYSNSHISQCEHQNSHLLQFRLTSDMFTLVVT